MKNAFSKILFLMASIIAVSCGHDKNIQADSSKERMVILTQEAAGAVENKIILSEIREGRISNAIEALEFAIDTSVVIIGQRTNSDVGVQWQIDAALRKVKEYRQKYPRNIQPTKTDKDEVEESAAISEKANQILKAVN